MFDFVVISFVVTPFGVTSPVTSDDRDTVKGSTSGGSTERDRAQVRESSPSGGVCWRGLGS